MFRSNKKDRDIKILKKHLDEIDVGKRKAETALASARAEERAALDEWLRVEQDSVRTLATVVTGEDATMLNNNKEQAARRARYSLLKRVRYEKELENLERMEKRTMEEFEGAKERAAIEAATEEAANAEVMGRLAQSMQQPGLGDFGFDFASIQPMGGNKFRKRGKKTKTKKKKHIKRRVLQKTKGKKKYKK